MQKSESFNNNASEEAKKPYSNKAIFHIYEKPRHIDALCSIIRDALIGKNSLGTSTMSVV